VSKGSFHSSVGRKTDMASTSARFLEQQADLEVVPPETGLYPYPAHTPLYSVVPEPLPKEQPRDVESGGNQQTPAHAGGQGQTIENTRRTVLGLSVPVFWALIVTLFVVLAAGIGGGVGGGLSAQHKSASGSDASRFVTF
jgi:hypothetical protein